MAERTNTIIVRKFAYDRRTPQAEVNLNLLTETTFSIQSISHTGVWPHRRIYSTMTQQNIAYNCNIINVYFNSHAFVCCASTEFTATSTDFTKTEFT